MKQILISKNKQIKALSGSQIEFTLEEMSNINGSELLKLEIPFKAKIMSGGKLDLDFSLPEDLAAKGISLLGAYWDGKTVKIYLRAIEGSSINLFPGDKILIGTLVQVVSYRQVEDGLLEGVVNVDQSGKVLAIEKPKSRRKPRKQ